MLGTTRELEANTVVSINKVPLIKEIEYLPAEGGRLRGFPELG